jgi:hypothetical protein
LEDARRELEVNGDFTLEALNVLRTAEDNRRGEKNDYFWIGQKQKPSFDFTKYFLLFPSFSSIIFFSKNSCPKTR